MPIEVVCPSKDTVLVCSFIGMASDEKVLYFQGAMNKQLLSCSLKGGRQTTTVVASVAADGVDQQVMLLVLVP